MNLSNRVSQDDLDRRNDMVHHPMYETGFDGGESDSSASDGFTDLFGGDDDEDPFGSSGGSSFGGDAFGGGGSTFGGSSFGGDAFGGGGSSFGGNSSFGGDAFGGGSSFGGNAFGGSSFGGDAFGGGGNAFGVSSNGFGNNFGNSMIGGSLSGGGFGGDAFGNNSFGGFGVQGGAATAQPPKPDVMDTFMVAAADTTKTIGSILMDLFKSINQRTADDFGFLSSNMIKLSVVVIPVSVLIGILGTISGAKILSFSGLGLQGTLAGALSLTSGIAGMGVASLILVRRGEQESGSVDDVSDLESSDDNPNANNFIDDFADSAGSTFDDLLSNSSDFDSLFEDDPEEEEPEPEPEPEEPEPEPDFTPDIEPVAINYNELLNSIQENTYISRETLFNTFRPMLPTNTPNFYEVKDIDTESSDFQTLETICLKALANLANCEMEDVNSKLESAKEGFFSYELRLKRINKVKKTDDLARELENYLREDSEDEAVTATVAIEGDFYKITVSKGTTAVVTFGDIFRDQKNADFYLNTKNKLPVIIGIDALGHVILEDAKLYDSMLIAGKPRSGKSWYVLSIIFSMMLFNSPEDVQFCIIDPKESNLFKTIALMPHVFGLHNHRHINKILDDLIEVEAPRRKKLLDDNRCDDIWALQKKGFRLPVIWLVIDEFMTVIGDFDDKDEKDAFNIKLRTLLSQLPSLGIRLLFVPHRATGIVDKTQRTLLQFTAAVRADTEDVKDTLGIMKWDRALVKPGDIALKTSTMKNAKYVRGAALTTEDAENTIFIEKAATAFYKMGVDIPDMSNMHVAYNRDDEKIKQELGGDSIRVQYNANNVFEDIENDRSVSVSSSVDDIIDF